MPQRFRSDAPDAAVFVAEGRQAVFTLGFNARKLQFLGEYFCQFIEAQVHFHHGRARLGAAALALAFADNFAFLAIARAHAAGVIAVAEMRQFYAAYGDADEMLAFLADELAF